MHHQGYDITHILGILGQKSSQPSWHFLGWQNRPNQLGVWKKPEPFQMGFPDAIFLFPIIVFLSVGFTPWSKNSHERGKGKGKGIVKEGKGKNRKGRGKGRERKRKGKGKRKQKEKERKTKGKGTEKETKKERKKDRKKERRRKRKSKGRDRKKDRKGRGKGEEKEKTKGKTRQCLTRTIFDAKSYRFRYRSWILCVCSFFSGNGCNHQKRSVATTYQAPSLCRICAITTTNNERKRPKALNSRRMMEKSRNLDFKSLDTDH